MEVVVYMVLRTSNGKQVSQRAVSKMVSDVTVQLIAQPEIMSMIAGGLRKSDKLMSFVANIVATIVK